MRRLLWFVLVLSTLLNLVPVEARSAVIHGNRSSAVTQSDADVAAATAVLFSEFEARGDFHALYDSIHPDAHAVVSRSAVVGWFQNEYLPRGPGVITVTGVRFVSWTWEVTGQTYPYTAEVAFEQPFYNEGQTVSDVVRLVPFDGTFRWFFGRNAEFVNYVVNTYGQAYQPPPIAATAETYIEFVYNDLDQFWRDQFTSAGFFYRSPALQLTYGPAVTRCGTSSAEASYCPVSETIFIDVYFAEMLLSNIEFALAFVMAHEFSHHVQHVAFGGYDQRLNIERELEADCLAGVWSLDVDTRGMLEANDTAEVVVLMEVIGDAYGTSPLDRAAHGSSAQRTASYLSGYYDGFRGCSVPVF